MADLPPSYDEVTNAPTKSPYPTKASAPYLTTGDTTPLATTGNATNTSGYAASQPGAAPPPPPQVYVPAQANSAPGDSVVVTQPTAILARNVYGYHPSQVTCQFCHKQTITRIEYRTGGATWLTCAVTALVGCWCGCCLIPFCVNGLKDVVHKCGECGKTVGYRKRLD